MTDFRAFQRSVVNFCRPKDAKSQALKVGGLKKKLLLCPPQTALRASGPADGSILRVSRTVTLHPFDLKKSTVPLCKDLKHIINKISAQGLVAFYI